MSHLQRALIVGLGNYGNVTAYGHSWGRLDSVGPDVKAIVDHYTAKGYRKKDIICQTDDGGRIVSGGDILDSLKPLTNGLRDGDSIAIFRLGHAVDTVHGPALVVYPGQPRPSDPPERAQRMKDGILLGKDMEDELYSLLPTGIQITIQIFNEACDSEHIDDPDSRLPARLRITKPLPNVISSGSGGVPVKSSNVPVASNGSSVPPNQTPLPNSSIPSAAPSLNIISVHSCKEGQTSYSKTGKTMLRTFLELDKSGSITNADIGEYLLDGFLGNILSERGIVFSALPNLQKYKLRADAKKDAKPWGEVLAKHSREDALQTLKYSLRDASKRHFCG